MHPNFPKHALHLDPVRSEEYFSLALGMAIRKDLPMGVRHLRQTLQIDPQHTDAAGSLQALLVQKADAEQATAELVQLRQAMLSR